MWCGPDGIEATRRITAAGPAPRVVVLTTFDVRLLGQGLSNTEIAGALFLGRPR